MTCTYNCRQGRACICGMFHANGGRSVNTKRDESPRPVPITLAQDDGLLTQEGASLLVSKAFWAIGALCLALWGLLAWLVTR